MCPGLSVHKWRDDLNGFFRLQYNIVKVLDRYCRAFVVVVVYDDGAVDS